MAASQNSETLERLAVELDAHPDYRVLRRLPMRTKVASPSGAPVARGIVLDTETTGRNMHTDEVVELGMVSFDYEPDTGRVLRIVDIYDELRDPGMPIPPEASAVSGITDEMVRGKSLNFDAIDLMLEQASLIVAHNAAYDRHMVERLDERFADKRWACSQLDVDWAGAGVSSGKLEFIANAMGFFYEAHRAEVDCRAVLEILSRPYPGTGEPVLKQLLAAACRTTVRIFATGARFETKDILARRGYRWSPGDNGMEKAWYTEVDAEQVDAEVAWLRESVYQNRRFMLVQDTMDASSRYSPRRGDSRRVYYD